MEESKNTNKHSLRVLLIIVAFLFTFIFGSLVGASSFWLIDSYYPLSSLRAALSATDDNTDSSEVIQTRDDLVSILWEAWDIIESDYLEADSLDTTELMRGAVRGMVDAVGDSHTLLLDPVAASIVSEDMSGEFQGIGVTVGMPDTADRLVAVDILDGSPAEEMGMQAGDAIIAVDGTLIEGLSMNDAITLIRGPEGTDVVLTIERDEETFDLTVTRRAIEYPSVSFEMLDDNIGYVALTEFNANADDQLVEALTELQDEGAEALVLDLRGNPGGLLDQAVKVSGEFLSDETLVVTEHGRNETTHSYRVNGEGVALDIPMVVLIDGNSASASEIVAGALQDLGRAELLGTQSYGKGSVQTLHALSDGSQLRVTIAKYALPSGTFIDGIGLSPDYVVELDEDAWYEGVDTQLDAAIELLLNGEITSNAE